MTVPSRGGRPRPAHARHRRRATHAHGWTFRLPDGSALHSAQPHLATHAHGWTLRWANGSELHAANVRISTDGTHRRSLAFVVAGSSAVLIGVGSGAAFAYFSAAGTGSSYAKDGTLAVTVEHASATPSSLLLPGETAPLYLRLTNPRTTSLTLTGIAEVGSSATVTPATATCAGNTGVTVPTRIGLSVTVPAGPGSVTVAVPAGAAMSTSSSTDCQTKSFHIPVTVSVET